MFEHMPHTHVSMTHVSIPLTFPLVASYLACAAPRPPILVVAAILSPAPPLSAFEPPHQPHHPATVRACVLRGVCVCVACVCAWHVCVRVQACRRSSACSLIQSRSLCSFSINRAFSCSPSNLSTCVRGVRGVRGVRVLLALEGIEGAEAE